MDEEDWDAEVSSAPSTVTLSTLKPSSNEPRATYNNTFESAKVSSYGADEKKARFSYGRGRMLSSQQSSPLGSSLNTFHASRDHSNSKNDNYDNSNKSGFSNYRNDRHESPSSSNTNRFSSYNNSSEHQGSYRDSYASTGSSNLMKTEIMNIEVRSISSIIGKSGATISNIREKCNVKINIPNRDELANQQTTDIKIIGSSMIDIQKAKEMIKNIVDQQSGNSSFGNKRNFPYENNSNNNYNKRYDSEHYDDNNNRSRSSGSRFGSSFSSTRPRDTIQNNQMETINDAATEPKKSFIDWDKVRAQPLQNMDKFKGHPPVVKDFYSEVDEIKSMTFEQVKQFRKENFDITVDLFKKERLTYGLKKEGEPDPNEDNRTPEEIEAYLFEKIPKPVRTFEQAFHNFPDILKECARQNFTKPSPVQSQMWPILLKGLDCVGIAQTGTGKTLAFLLPALVHIDNQITPREKRLGPNVLVLSPTRELALQIEQEVKKINYKGIKSVCVYGGGDRQEQVNVCDKGVQIVIATPGRLYDLIQAGVINVTSVTYLVLDEADRMLDLGFEPQIMKILLDIRPDRQTVMTSATWPQGVRRLATKYLAEPIQLYVGSLDLRAAKTVTQELLMVESDDDKKERLMKIIQDDMIESDKLLVFVGRKATADFLSTDLILKNIRCQVIHGDREQCDREEALEDFKTGEVRILIATDVASRGIDVKDITCVVNFDFPRNIEEYVHRVGRTGRAGRTGTSITFMAREDWKHAKELIEILKQGEQFIPESLISMSERYEKHLKKREEERESGRAEGGGGRGRGRGRGGGGGGRRNDTFAFGGSGKGKRGGFEMGGFSFF